jgi:hypothetical protein
VAGLTHFVPGEPTDQVVKVRGVKATKKMKAGANIWRHVLFADFTTRQAMKVEHFVAGKLIGKIPGTGGFFSHRQLLQSASWPALEFLQQHVSLMC